MAVRNTLPAMLAALAAQEEQQEEEQPTTVANNDVATIQDLLQQATQPAPEMSLAQREALTRDANLGRPVRIPGAGLLQIHGGKHFGNRSFTPMYHAPAGTPRAMPRLPDANAVRPSPYGPTGMVTLGRPGLPRLTDAEIARRDNARLRLAAANRQLVQPPPGRVDPNVAMQALGKLAVEKEGRVPAPTLEGQLAALTSGTVPAERLPGPWNKQAWKEQVKRAREINKLLVKHGHPAVAVENLISQATPEIRRFMSRSPSDYGLTPEEAGKLPEFFVPSIREILPSVIPPKEITRSKQTSYLQDFLNLLRDNPTLGPNTVPPRQPESRLLSDPRYLK